MGRVYRQFEDEFSIRNPDGSMSKREILFDVEYDITTMMVLEHGKEYQTFRFSSRELIPLLALIALDCGDYVK